MLIGNHTVLNKTPGRWLGGTSTAHASGIGSAQVGLLSNWGNAGANRNFAYQDRSTDALEYFGIPSGYGGKGWLLPIKAGYLSSITVIKGTGSFTGSAAAGKNGATTISAAATVTATGQLVVSGSATITASATVTANVFAARAAAATITASATPTAAITAKAWGTTSISGSATVTGTRYATGTMAADITPFTELSPQSLASAVWAQALEAGYTAEEMMRVMAAAMAGEVSGAGTSTIVIRDIADSKTRITATVDGTGNRTAVTLDAA